MQAPIFKHIVNGGALLGACLTAYGLPDAARSELPRRALACTLLHRFDVLAGVFARWSAARQVASLDQLARLLWDFDAPGLDE